MSSYTKSATVSTTGTSITSLVPAQGDRSFINLYLLAMSNESATDTFVDVLDGSTVVLKRMSVAAGIGNNIKFDKPLRLAENTALSVQASVGVTTLNCSAVYDVEPRGNG